MEAQPTTSYPPQHQHQPQPSSSDPADILLSQFPSTSKLTREDLEELLRNPAYFDAFVGTLPQVTELEQEHERHLRQNVQTAESNMGLREEHERLKAETLAAFNEAKELQARWAHIAQAQEEAYKRFAPPLQLSRLRTAFSDQDRLSEQLIASLNAGNLDTDDFAREFKEVRRLYHRRGLQIEKWLGGQVEWRD